jgi:integrase
VGDRGGELRNRCGQGTERKTGDDGRRLSLVSVLRAAKAKQAAERLVAGSSYRAGEYVVINEIGDPYHPQVLSRYWRDAVKAAGLRPIKLHAARHTAATAMHLAGVPVAVIAAWIGHKDASLTMRLYAHSQDDALKAAGDTFNRVVTSS